MVEMAKKAKPTPPQNPAPRSLRRPGQEMQPGGRRVKREYAYFSDELSVAQSDVRTALSTAGMREYASMLPGDQAVERGREFGEALEVLDRALSRLWELELNGVLNKRTQPSYDRDALSREVDMLTARLAKAKPSDMVNSFFKDVIEQRQQKHRALVERMLPPNESMIVRTKK